MFTLDHAGAVRRLGMLSREEIRRVAGLFPSALNAGIRVGAGGLAEVRELVCADGPIGCLAAEVLGCGARPVRALLFDKTQDLNWSLAWHQDRTICVREKLPSPEFARWSIKAGEHHVEPPFALTEAMVTLRVHVDEVHGGNSPLLILPGSHRLGRLCERSIEELTKEITPEACLAAPGDVWVYRTAIVHASAAKTSGGRRRVLQLDYAAFEPPGGLQWVELC
jgi:hypothetical protein